MPKANMILPTITVKEAAERLKNLGVKTSPTKIMVGIQQGVYPFGVCIEMDKYQYEIYERKFDEWVSERTVLARELS